MACIRSLAQTNSQYSLGIASGSESDYKGNEHNKMLCEEPETQYVLKHRKNEFDGSDKDSSYTEYGHRTLGNFGGSANYSDNCRNGKPCKKGEVFICQQGVGNIH